MLDTPNQAKIGYLYQNILNLATNRVERKCIQARQKILKSLKLLSLSHRHNSNQKQRADKRSHKNRQISEKFLVPVKSTNSMPESGQSYKA